MAAVTDYMLVKAQFFDPDEADLLAEKELALAMKNTAVIDDFNRCRTALFYRLRRQHRQRGIGTLLQYYLTAQNIHERISSRHVDYAALAHRLAHSDLIYRIQRLIVLQAQACRQMSECLHEDKPYVFNMMLASGRVVSLKCSIDHDTLASKPQGRKVKGVIHWGMTRVCLRFLVCVAGAIRRR